MAKIADEIESKLLMGQAKRVGRVIAFSRAPIAGSFRADGFQVFPLPESAVRPKVGFADHPFVLEFEYITSADVMVKSNRKRRRSVLLVRMLNLLLATGVTMPLYTSHAWVLDWNQDGEVTTDWRQLGYYSSDVDMADPRRVLFI